MKDKPYFVGKDESLDDWQYAEILEQYDKKIIQLKKDIELAQRIAGREEATAIDIEKLRFLGDAYSELLNERDSVIKRLKKSEDIRQ